MHAAIVSAVLVAFSEIGDKTQILALVLASRFRRPIPIILGMVTATVLNHAMAGLAGGFAAAVIAPDVLRWILALIFLAMAGWTLIPGTLDQTNIGRRAAGGTYVAIAVIFFLAEMGDKTQIATAALAARFGVMLPVIGGSAIGMMAVDIPTVLFGHLAGDRLNPRWVRYVAAALFALYGLLAFFGADLALW
jgi:Ca2+/H+ antiporter, TMEM165/GDT1 family